MSRAFVFWFLMLLWLLFGLWWYWPPAAAVGLAGYGGLGVPLLVFLLFAVLGWQVFGSPVKG
jgi:hypothetical protein